MSCYDDGHPFNPSTFSGLFGDILKRNKLPQIRFHDLRHTNATLMLKNNIPAKVASERLGHSTIGITLDLYSHVLKEMQEEAANKIANAIFKHEKGTI
ncbi:MAG TPA: tyrosine-type recombinase/integrase [Clostridia bacterium]|nr:tyrosine-type recombinase/integrase [Clostridia bacterium]